MKEKVLVDLIYEGKFQDEKGSSKTSTIKIEKVKADLLDNFSSYYYSDNERNMRLSKNFIIPKAYTKGKFNESDSVNCELMYVEHSNKLYRIKNILLNKSSYLTCILDTQQEIK
ncbi:MAG: hypothetical protein Q4E99_05375 [Bacillota bacterium]|nr:hypothetical protein [Bacillota bacterium]